MAEEIKNQGQQENAENLNFKIVRYFLQNRQ